MGHTRGTASGHQSELPTEILNYWLDEVGPKGWYAGGEALDQQIRDRFLSTWQRTMQGANALWLTHASGTLAYILVTDQFSRNMFRDTAEAFSSDRIALTAAKAAIAKGWDMRIDAPARQFFYMPLMHSENLCDQDRAVRLFLTRMPQEDAQDASSNLLHARAHREVIRKFGRFPTRNAALGRNNTAPETAFLAAGGYGATVNELKAAA